MISKEDPLKMTKNMEVMCFSLLHDSIMHIYALCKKNPLLHTKTIKLD